MGKDGVSKQNLPNTPLDVLKTLDSSAWIATFVLVVKEISRTRNGIEWPPNKF